MSENQEPSQGVDKRPGIGRTEPDQGDGLTTVPAPEEGPDVATGAFAPVPPTEVATGAGTESPSVSEAGGETRSLVGKPLEPDTAPLPPSGTTVDAPLGGSD